MWLHSAELKVKWFAISSRIFVFVLQLVANYAIPDHVPDVFMKPRPALPPLLGDKVLQVLTEGLTRWDGQYFLHIAEYGYTYENTVAFLPLFPLCLRLLALPFQVLVNDSFQLTGVPFFLTTHDALVLMSIVLNGVLFVHCALLLHELTLKITGKPQLAYISALMFCVNPASIFFSATYSETLFFFLTLNGMLYVESRHLMWGSLMFGLASITRSNGLLNIGYVAYNLLKPRIAYPLSVAYACVLFAGCLVVQLLPFVGYQLFCYAKFCVPSNVTLPDLITNHAALNNFVLPGNRSSWCDDAVPVAYFYVQNHYWDVGFLKYYQLKQVPNFVLAFPCLLLTWVGFGKFIHEHGRSIWRSLGLAPGDPSSMLPPACFPYAIHALALSLFAVFCMHVQVSTRLMFSSCPALYWFVARRVVMRMSESREAAKARRIAKDQNIYFETWDNQRSRWKTVLLTERVLRFSGVIRYYFFSYFLAGPTIFSNFLPWT